MSGPEHPIERIGKFFPIFIIILIIIIAVVYLQSLKVISDTDKDVATTTSSDIQEDISRGADVLFESLGFSATSLLESERQDIESRPLPSSEEIVIEVESSRLEEKKDLPRAIEFVRPMFVNSDSFRLVDLVGKKVVLLEFCTFSSMNCIRGAPFMEGIYEKYKDFGLEVITVHTPEFEFEQEPKYIMQSARDLGITYPMIIDNDYYTWRAYKNRYWPTRYLIDIDGFIAGAYPGEGYYYDIENKTKELLAERAEVLVEEVAVPSDFLRVYVPDFSSVKTPTIYFGAMKNRGDFGNDEGFMTNLPVIYTLPDIRIPNVVYVEGEWFNNNEYLELVSDEGRIILEYTARDVDMVSGGGGSLNVTVDGSAEGDVFINDYGHYRLVSDKVYASHKLDIDIKNQGFRIYSLSFS